LKRRIIQTQAALLLAFLATFSGSSEASPPPKVPPTNTSPPRISGTAQEGQTLTANRGSWTGTQPISYTYQWRRCDSTGGACIDLAGATATSYVLSSADVGFTLRVAVTATNSVGASTAASAATAVVIAASSGTSPANTSPPTISGTAQEGQTLTADPGTWTGTQPISYTYQWRRCDTTGGACIDLAGATATSYVLSSADVGFTLRVAVTATNSVGASTAASAPTATVTAAGSATAPANTSPPTISGTAQEGQTLTANPGTWTGTTPISYTYQWRRCGSDYAQTVLADAPASFWRLGETSGTAAVDERGSNPGVYNNGVQLGVAGALSGNSNTAVGFDGSNDYVGFGNPSVSGPFTLELWVFVAGPGTAGSTIWDTLVGYDYTHRILVGTTSPARLLTQFDGNFYSVTGIGLKAWHHIVYTFDGSTERFYTDGAENGSHATTRPTWQAPFKLGAYDLANYMFKGRIDEFALYRTALTPAQVQRHYLAGAYGGCSDIAGATAVTYAVTKADVGKSLDVLVTATNSAGSSSQRSQSSAAVQPLGPPNPIQIENAQPGSAWTKPDAPSGAIEGYTSEISALPGEQVAFHVSTNPAARYRVEIYRLGWYGAAGARLFTCLPGCTSDEAGATQPIPAPDPTTGKLDANWPVTDTLTVPSDWVSGYYIAKLVLTSGTNAGTAGTVPFFVRAPSTRNAPILVQASVNTWEAYNNWGGKSLYASGSTGGVAATKVSFNRPFGGPQGGPFNWEYQAVRFLEREGYDVSYTTDVDTHRAPSELLRHKLVISLGHDEYWTKEMRDAFEAARDNTINLAFLGGNDGYWQMRYADGERTIVEYRSASLDPEPNSSLKTVRFRDLVPPRPECTLLGAQSQGGQSGSGDPPRDYSVVGGSLSDSWFSATGFAPSSTLVDLVGYEWDAVQAGCTTPPLTVFFHYTGSPSNGDATRYTATSGARVFDASSIQFSWGLDDWAGHDPPTDTRLQQFMRNAIGDLTSH
jgi:hypothetical protein